MVKTISVCMITYNHSKYILDALNSIFSQNVNAKIELIISDDNSTDETPNIINQFIKENKSKDINIHFFKQEKNLGMFDNFIFALSRCSGDYIAILDGDDLWYENKLNIQFQFMEKNENISGLFSKYDLLRNDKIITNTDFKNSNRPIDLNDFLDTHYSFCTCTSFIRNQENLANELKSFKNNYFADWYLWLILLQKKKFYIQEEILGIYRINSLSVTNTSKQIDRWKYNTIIPELYPQYIPKKYHSIFKKTGNKKLSKYYLKKMDLLLCIKYFIKSVI